MLANDMDVDNASLTAIVVTPPQVGVFNSAQRVANDTRRRAGFIGDRLFTYKVSDGTVGIRARHGDAGDQFHRTTSRHQRNPLRPGENTSRPNSSSCTTPAIRPWTCRAGISRKASSTLSRLGRSSRRTATFWWPRIQPRSKANSVSRPSVRGSGAQNDGEEVILRNALGDQVDRVDYGIGYPWPTERPAAAARWSGFTPCSTTNWAGAGGPRPNHSTPRCRVLILPAATYVALPQGDERSLDAEGPGGSRALSEDATWLTGRTPIGYGDGEQHGVGRHANHANVQPGYCNGVSAAVSSHSPRCPIL